MPFDIIDVPQRSEGWFRARAGRLTGSSAKDMLSKGKGKKESAGRRNLRTRLVAERLTGESHDEGYRGGYKSAPMRWGEEAESEAIGAYEAVYGALVRSVGFLSHTEVMAGCSPDGYVGNFEGLLEVKCPNTTTHLGYIRTGDIDAYIPQIKHNMWVGEFEWCDFISFDPRLPENMRLFVKRYERDKLDIVGYEISARAFLTEVEQELKALGEINACKQS